MAKNDGELELDLEEIQLTEEEKQSILNNKQLFNALWLETTDALIIKHWPFIMIAQAEKAKRGDTASAKFITDFIADRATQTHDTGNNLTGELWEEKAILLRNQLGLEIGAGDLVLLILNKLLEKPDMMNELLAGN